MKAQFVYWMSQVWRAGKNSPKFVMGLIGLCLGILGLVAGIRTSFDSKSCQGNQQSAEVRPDLLSSNQVKRIASASASAQIVVDISGGVKKPGIYELAPDSRIFAALEKAGGLTPDADLGYIQQHLNLAEKLQEGEKIYFPLNQTDTDTCLARSSSIPGSTNLISLNSASAAELDSLPGLGEKLSAKIIAGRPYFAVSELVTRIKISQTIFDKIKTLLEL